MFIGKIKVIYYTDNDVYWNNKGWALCKLERYEEALECYDKAIEINSKNSTAWNNKERVLNKLKELEGNKKPES